MLDTYLKLLEQGLFEAKFAFEGVPDEDVWKRPAKGLLSLGELAGHIAYWEAVRLAGAGVDAAAGTNGIGLRPNAESCTVTSPLVDSQFEYYHSTLVATLTDQQRAMTAEQVYNELCRVHAEAAEYFTKQNFDLESSVPGWPPAWTYKGFLEYLVFHIGYHIGQMYSVRHLLEHVPPDN